MDDDDDEYAFSDADFDPDALETQAIAATQHHHHHHGVGEDAELIDLNGAGVVPHGPPTQWQTASAFQYAGARAQQAYHADPSNQPFYHDEMDVDRPEPPGPPRSQADPDQLLVRIRKAEQEKARMKRELDAEKAQALAKSGEAHLLRNRERNLAVEHSRKISALQQQHNDTVAKLQADLARMRKEREADQTNNKFMEHDAMEDRMAQRPRRGAGALAVRSRPAATNMSPATTPKRGQKTVLPARGGDGFDENDIVMASPSKNREKSRGLTPKQAAKRKRQVTDASPIPALQLSEPREKPKDEHEPGVNTDATRLRVFRKEDRRYSLLHRLLSHRSSSGTDRILEALSQHAFPSKPDKKLSSIVYDILSKSSASITATQLALALGQIFIDLWTMCLQEKHYVPVCLVLDAIHFILAYESTKTAIQLGPQLVPLIISSVDLVATPISKAAKGDKQKVNELYSPAQCSITSQVNVIDCLDLLHVIATSCISSIEKADIEGFWRLIPLEFAVQLLTKEQPLPQIKLMLRIISTSALPASLGPIPSADVPQEVRERREDSLIFRLTNLFVETPRPIPDPSDSTPPRSPISEPDIWDLRLSVVTVLTKFSVPFHGAARLARNRNCIGRLFKHLDRSITSLYTHPLSPSQSLKIDTINATMKLIHHIKISVSGFDVKSKLVGILGGQHAYLVSLTRLAFSDGIAMEAGLEDQVCDMAHAILDESGLGPEEGDGLADVFGSGSST